MVVGNRQPLPPIVADTPYAGCARNPAAPLTPPARSPGGRTTWHNNRGSDSLRRFARKGRITSIMWLVRLLVTALFAYVLGAIPTGLLVGRLFGGIDVRNYGSRSTGATNVLRTLGPGASACVAAADFLKGSVAVLLIRQLYPQQHWTHGLAAVLVAVGHSWPVFAGFRGGKGVLTSLGGLIPLYPQAMACVIGVGVPVLWRTRYASLASLSGALITAVALVSGGVRRSIPTAYVVCGSASVALVVLRHRENIARLLAGTERRLGERVDSPPDTQAAQ